MPKYTMGMAKDHGIYFFRISSIPYHELQNGPPKNQAKVTSNLK